MNTAEARKSLVCFIDSGSNKIETEEEFEYLLKAAKKLDECGADISVSDEKLLNAALEKIWDYEKRSKQ